MLDKFNIFNTYELLIFAIIANIMAFCKITHFCH